MKSKTFFVVSLIVIAIVAIITSLVTISMLKKQVLPAPYGTTGEGKVEVTGTIESPIVNVIIIDDSVIAQIEDIVNFTNVQKGIEYSTSTFIPAPAPRPFVLRNEGNVKSNVKVYSTLNKLFDAAGSYVKFFVEPATNTVPETGWDVLDNCALNGPCYNSTTCTSAAACNLPYGADSSVAVSAISGFEYLNQKDEAFMGIKIFVGADEGAGTKWTKVVIIGSQA